jgi:hypothetical protein
VFRKRLRKRGRKANRSVCLDHRISMMIDLQIPSELPLGSTPGVALQRILVHRKAPRTFAMWGFLFACRGWNTYKLHKAVNGSMIAGSRQSEVAFAVRNQDGS